MRKISEIAYEIEENWTNIHYAAKPYLDAMKNIDFISDKYGYDSAKSIILYFLSTARTFKGEKARALKLELSKIVGITK